MQIAGSAGRPLTSVVAVMISVAPSSATIANQVHATRRPKRSAAARNSAKKRMSGGPRFAVLSSPGTRKAIETVSNTCGCCSTTYSVGPRHTEIASTHGMITAISAAHITFSNQERNQKPMQTSANSFARLLSTSSSVKWSRTASAASASPAGSTARLARSGSSSQTSANVAGKRTSVRKRRSGQSPLSQSRSAPAV